MVACSPRRGTESLLAFLVCVCLITLAWPGQAFAQKQKKDDPSHWGVAISGVNSWSMSPRIKKLLDSDNPDGVNIEGKEFSIGFVRGSRLGGDWGVSFVRKPWKDGSGETTNDQDCFNQAQTICKPRTEVSMTQGVYTKGFEVHWFIAAVTIKQRVQLGVNVAGGLGTMKGKVNKTTDSFQPTGFNQNGPTGYTAIHEVENLEAADELLKYFPNGKVEFVASVTVAPGVKIQFADGLNFPAMPSFRFGGVVLIGK
jgi:hypothetical protein